MRRAPARAKGPNSAPKQNHERHVAKSPDGPVDDDKGKTDAPREHPLVTILNIIGLVVFAALAGLFGATDHIVVMIWCVWAVIFSALLLIAHLIGKSRPWWRTWTRIICFVGLMAVTIWFVYWSWTVLHPKTRPNVTQRQAPTLEPGSIDLLAQVGNRAQPDRPVTKEELDAFEQRLDAMLRQNPQNTNFLDKALPGISVHLILRLGKPIKGRDNFIFDCGEKANRNRFSVFMDPEFNLCCRAIDKDSKVTEVKVGQALDTFDVNNLIYVICEYGSSDTFSFVRILINGRQVAEKHQDFPIAINPSINGASSTLAADLDGRNQGVFLSLLLLAQPKTITTDQMASLLKTFNEFIQSKNEMGVYFDGHGYYSATGNTNK